MRIRFAQLFVFAVLLWPGNARAQGTFIFSNHILSVGIDQPVLNTMWYPPDGRTPGPNMVAAIYRNGIQLGNSAPFRTGNGAGYWDPGEDNERVVIGKFSGEPVSGFTVQVWDSRYGNNRAQARAAGGLEGESSPFTIVLGGPKRDPLLPAGAPGIMSNFRGFDFAVPEPAVLSLAALGALVLFSRRSRDHGS